MNAGAYGTRRRSILGLILCVGLGASMSIVVLRSNGDAQEIDLGNEYINRARSAALTYDFGGEIEVVWSGPDGPERGRIAVRSQDGILSLGKNEEIVIQGPARFSKGDAGWETLWAQTPDQPVRSAADKWELSVRGGPLIAGRATREVEAVNPETGTVTERRYFDAVTGLLLRRAQFDDSGKRVRYATYTSITLPPQIPPGSAPKVPTKSNVQQPKNIERIPTGYQIPLGVGDGYHLNGAYERDDGVLQLFYSDGLFSASVFQQEGTLDRDDLDPGGVDREIDGHFVHEYEVPMGTVMVWERDGLVFTSVSDAPADELVPIVTSFGSEPAFLHKALDYVLGPLSW